jgi:2-methylcitrate dehydratase PrpD
MIERKHTDSTENDRTHTISGKLAAFAHGLRADQIPEAALTRAKHLILDAIGIAIASRTYEFAGVIWNGISAVAGPGPSSVIGRSEGLPLRDAILMNGALIHGLDYDDTHMKAIVHATAGCLPVALAVGQDVKASGRDALVAYVAGMEAAVRLGVAAKGGFHHVGFHPTGITAHFTSTLIAGKLYGLTADQIQAAQGIAASTASACQVFLEEGTWSKRLHPGWGGVGGVTAVRLAQHGFVAPTRPYEGRWGLFDAFLQEHAKDVDYGAITRGLGEVWEVQSMAIKPYPVCHFLHACAEAGEDLHAEGGFRIEDIERIQAFIPKDTIAIVTEPVEKKRRPTTDYEAKFSTQYVTAASLVRGRFGLAELQPEAMKDETILRLSERVECLPDPDTAFPDFFSGGIVVTMKDGRVFRKHHRVNKGAGERDLTNADIVRKYMATATVAISATDAERIAGLVLTLDQRDIASLWSALTSL